MLKQLFDLLIIHIVSNFTLYFILCIFFALFMLVHLTLGLEAEEDTNKTYYYLITNYYGFRSEDVIKYNLEYIVNYVLPDLCLIQSKYVIITFIDKSNAPEPDCYNYMSKEFKFFFNNRSPISVDELYDNIIWTDVFYENYKNYFIFL
jgi:hypothetical protein